MSRYWINFGYWGDGYDDDESEKRVREKLDKLASRTSETANLQYVTEDLEDAIKVYREAKKIIEAEGFDSENLFIERQPECPECGYLGRFSHKYCPRCGVKLTTAIGMDEAEAMLADALDKATGQ
jgi:predicted Zn-ribbon and HTH transcriptional regulator